LLTLLVAIGFFNAVLSFKDRKNWSDGLYRRLTLKLLVIGRSITGIIFLPARRDLLRE